MNWLLDPDIWASFITLSALEIVLGVDNLVFIALLAGRLPAERQGKARKIGLALALGTRLALLGSIAFIVHLTEPVVSLAGWSFSWRDLVLLGGGSFLMFKGTREIHLRVEGEDEHEPAAGRHPGFVATIIQIVLFDIVFSLDSVITAVGIANEIWVMVAAIVVAMMLMLAASNPLSSFIDRHASVKMLALSFLLLIGTMLMADGLGFHVPRGYVYAAMGFSIMVEALNLLSAKRRRMKRGFLQQKPKTRASLGLAIPPG
ncbi:TerC family protein [Rhodopila sp.]|uniref:TerC family protein n=1 Tax=Rhodopila sp. TaxID=2480087 RepID=UPI003D131C18